MPRNVTRTEWRAVALDMAIESSSMDVMLRGVPGERRVRRQSRPILRVLFRTASGKVFSGPRISKALRAELDKLAGDGPWLKGKRRR